MQISTRHLAARSASSEQSEPAAAEGGQQAHKRPQAASSASSRRVAAIRRFRLPVAAEVALEHGVPVRLRVSSRMLSGGLVTHRAGPWRTSGQWWTADRDTWDRDEWDVGVDTGVIYRLARDRATDRWEVEGLVD